MLSIVKGLALEGLDGYLVDVQCDVSGGLPSFEIIGLPDIRVKESKERVKTAIKNSGIEFPSRRMVVNLAPADKRKEGTFFDLSIAVGILTAIGEIKKNSLKQLEETIFLGELSLNGKINRINGVLPMCMEAKKLGIKKILIPKDNMAEASIIQGIEIIPVSDLKEVIEYLKGNINIKQEIIHNDLKFDDINDYLVDFSEVKGQENAKRALEIAAAGGHNCLLIRKSRIRKNNVI